MNRLFSVRLLVIMLVLFATSVVIAQNATPEVTPEETEETMEQEAAPSVILEGFAVLPADTFAEGPAAGGAIDPAGENNGRTVPFESQPVQGVSAILPAGNGNYYVMSDNGFGSKGNSADYNLRFYEVSVLFDGGTVEVVGYTELSDPDGLVPFPIVNEESEDRILTGADFDLESFRIAPDGTIWFGEEFGPYLLHTDAEGKLLQAPIPTPLPEVLAEFARDLEFVQSPQNPDFVALESDDARAAAANLPGSRGFEGMAMNTSGTTLYPLLEGGLVDDTDRSRLLIQEFDLEATAYTGSYWFYPISDPAHAIGDFTAINDSEFLVIERDGGQGADAAFKRIYLVNLDGVESGSVLEKTLIVDLMQISDTSGLTAEEEGAIGFGEVFTFPFVTIESVYPVDEDTLIVVNDNNFPFSSGRRPGVDADNTEFILLTLPEALNVTMMQ